METKYLLLVTVLVAFFACVLTAQIAKEEEEAAKILVKRSVEDLLRDAEYSADQDSNLVKSRQKRGVFYGSYLIMGIICGLGGLVILAGLGYCIFMLAFRRSKLGTGVGEDVL